MQFFEGRPIRRLTPKSTEAQLVVNEIVHAALKQVLVDGVFHGDPHAGNLLYGEDGAVCMIDLGMVGRISQEQRDNIVTLVTATIANDITTVGRVLLRMGTDAAREPERVQGRPGSAFMSSIVVVNFGEHDSPASLQSRGRPRHRIKLASDMVILARPSRPEDIIRRCILRSTCSASPGPFSTTSCNDDSPQRILRS
jgi:ubiquinone biosynthesis protein